MALYDFQSAGITTTNEFNDMMKFFHHYHKALANGKTEDQAKNEAQTQAGLNPFVNVDDYKNLKSGRFPRRDEMSAIISEFKTYAKGEVDKAADDEKEAQDKFDEAQKIQDEGQDAATQIADIKREKRNIRLKKGLVGYLATAAALCVGGPLLLGGALASSAIIGVSALAGVGFAKFRGDKEIHELGLDDRKLIHDLKQKIREAQRQNTDYLAKQRNLARQQTKTRNANSRFNNYEQVGSVYENVLEDERSDARNQLIQLQNDIMTEKGKAHFVTSGKGATESQATEQQVDNASQTISTKLTELDNLPMDNTFQSKMEAILKDAEAEKTKVVNMDLEHKDFVAEVDNAIKEVETEASAYENYYNSFDESIKADSEVDSKYTACTNVYSAIYGAGTLDDKSVSEIKNTLTNLKSKSSELKGAIRKVWLESQNSSSLPESTTAEQAYKYAVKEAEKTNNFANSNTNPAQQVNADAIAELNFLRARLLNLEQQREATGKEDVGYFDPIKGMVLVNVKNLIADALIKVNAGLTAVSGGAKSPLDALNEVETKVNISEIAKGVRILTASAGRSNAPTDDERNKTDRELADIDSRMNKVLTNFKTKQADKFKFQEAKDLFNETSNIKQELEKIKNDKNRIKNATTKQDLENIKNDALKKEEEIKAKLRESLAKEKELAEKEKQEIAGLSKDIENLYNPFEEKYITKKEDLRGQYYIDDQKYQTATDTIKKMYENGFKNKSEADKTGAYLKQFKKDLDQAIKDQIAEIDKLKQPQSTTSATNSATQGQTTQNTVDPLQGRKDALKNALKNTYKAGIQKYSNQIKTIYKKVAEYEGLAKQEYNKFMNITEADIDNWDDAKLTAEEKNIPTEYKKAEGYLYDAIVEQRDIDSYKRQIDNIRDEHRKYMQDPATAMDRAKLTSSNDTSLAEYTNLNGEIAKYLNSSPDVITADGLYEYCNKLRTAAQNYEKAVNAIKTQGKTATPPQNQGTPGVTPDASADATKTPGQATQQGQGASGANNNANPGQTEQETQDAADDKYIEDALRELNDIERSNKERFNEYAKNLSSEIKQKGITALNQFFNNVRGEINLATTKEEINTLLNGSKDMVNELITRIEQQKGEKSPEQINSDKESLQGHPTAEELQGLPKAEELKGLPDGRRQKILDNIGSELFGKTGSKSNIERVSQEALKLENYKQGKLKELETIKASCMSKLDNPKIGLNKEEKKECRELLEDSFNDIKTDMENAETEKDVDKCIENADAVPDRIEELINQIIPESNDRKEKVEEPAKTGDRAGRRSTVKVEVTLIKNIEKICAKVKGGFANFRHERVIGKEEYLVDEGEVRDLCDKYINKLGISEKRKKELGLDNESIKKMSLEELVERCNGLENEAQNNDEDEREM